MILNALHIGSCTFRYTCTRISIGGACQQFQARSSWHVSWVGHFVALPKRSSSGFEASRAYRIYRRSSGTPKALLPQLNATGALQHTRGADCRCVPGLFCFRPLCFRHRSAGQTSLTSILEKSFSVCVLHPNCRGRVRGSVYQKQCAAVYIKSTTSGNWRLLQGGDSIQVSGFSYTG